MRQHQGAATLDHWTSAGRETYSATTYHYIEDWVLKKILIDFSVHEGTTTGEAIFNHQTNVLEIGTEEVQPFCFFAVADTTGNMGTFMSHARDVDVEAGYCTDHNLHLNAILAFKGEMLFLFVQFLFS